MIWYFQVDWCLIKCLFALVFVSMYHWIYLVDTLNYTCYVAAVSREIFSLMLLLIKFSPRLLKFITCDYFWHPLINERATKMFLWKITNPSVLTTCNCFTAAEVWISYGWYVRYDLYTHVDRWPGSSLKVIHRVPNVLHLADFNQT